MHLSSLTLCCVDTQYPEFGFAAIQRTCSELSFSEVLFFTNPEYELPDHNILNLKTITSEEIKSVDDYSRFMLKGLRKYIKSSYVLVIQWDGFVIKPHLWQKLFLQYDYIGAPWPKKSGFLVGNGGFSLRSAKLLAALQDNRIASDMPEDVVICDVNRQLLEKVYGIHFAPSELAQEFSFEFCPPVPNVFGFHGMSNFPKVMSSHELIGFVKSMPPELVFNGYFSGFLGAVNALKNPTLQVLMEEKISLAIYRLGDYSQRRERVHRLIKVLIKSGWLKLGVKILRLDIDREGWCKKNIQLMARVLFGYFHLR